MNDLCLDRLPRGNDKDTFCYTGAEAGVDVEERIVAGGERGEDGGEMRARGFEGEEADAGFGGVGEREGGAARV